MYVRSGKCLLPLTLSFALSVFGATFEGFLPTETTPTVPNDDPALLVQKIWEFDFEDNPTMIKFVPGTGQVITIHKTGRIRLYESIDVDVDEYIELMDMRPEVFSFGDHGLMSLEFHPKWLEGEFKAFVMYTGETKDVTTLPNNAAVTPNRPPGWGEGPPGTTGYTWLDFCENLDLSGNGENREGVLCEHPYYVDRIAIDVEMGTAVKEVTLVQSACGSSSTHGPGHILKVGNDLIFSVGDASQFTVLDYGWEDDGCYDPTLPAGQGVYRSIREEFANGKITRIPEALLDSEEMLEWNTLPVIVKGSRQPFRMFYEENSDMLYTADVGFGDAGTTERIFSTENVALKVDMNNHGWPCVEGVLTSTYGELGILDAASEEQRYYWLKNNGYDYCDATWDAAQAFVDGEAMPATGDPNWKAPDFEYRVFALDPDYPDLCVDNYGAITSVYFNQGTNLPTEYAGKLMFSDYAKQCTYYFDNDENGLPDFTTTPHLLLVEAGFVSMETGPDGALYGIDYTNTRLLRISSMDGEIVTNAPTAAVSMAPTALIPTETAEMCYDPMEMPELEWEMDDDGEYFSTLTFEAADVELSYGSMRTFSYNGMIPGPLIRMKPCGVYHLNLVNNLEGWSMGVDGPENNYKDPTLTNIHLHGLHVSGLPPGDDVFSVVLPGETKEYVYTIPCDHSGGTNWYHPHGHGSSAMQLSGGAAGMLIIESSSRESANMPADIQNLPEQFLFIQDFNPTETYLYSLVSKDQVFVTDIEEPFTLLNGCETGEMTLEAGQWMHLHMLHSGVLYNAKVTIAPTAATDPVCEVGLMGKDGVWLAEVPRIITDNMLFFTQSSRLEVAIRCPLSGKHTISYVHVEDPLAPEEKVIGTINVIESLRATSEDLTVWTPCRPSYLTDLTTLTAADMGDEFTIEVRQTINGVSFTAPDDYIHAIAINETQQWAISGSDQHTLHTHVYHMQIADVVLTNQFEDFPDWHQAGDWVDSISAKGTIMTRINAVRFNGPMLLHCHILSHEDTGMMVVVEITGEGQDAEASPEILDYGTCPLLIPASTPFGLAPIAVPGIIEAEEFDAGGEGVAYHNYNYPLLAAPASRVESSVEVGFIGDSITIGRIMMGEWLKYTVDVAAAGMYQVTMTQSSVEPLRGMVWSLWDGIAECPPPSQEEGFLLRYEDPVYAGTGDFGVFEDIVAPDLITLTAGEHTLLLCFEVNAYLQFDKLDVKFCGALGKLCPMDDPVLAAANLGTASAPNNVGKGTIEKIINYMGGN